ncbi:MAG: DUF3261 domain-containing protein [Treponema sp.]|nr:DUF3261 domain-containing protein [Treponema sp.]MBR4463348.1 DUF3261 domain-containing protein [Treponema sp.]
MKKLIFLLSLLTVLLLSCGSTKVISADASLSGSSLNPVYITDKKSITLLPTRAVEKNIDAVQHFKAHFGQKDFESDCLLIADSEKLTVTILNNFGTTMGELNYNNNLVVFNSDLFPKSIKAEYIVADIQFCLYRAADIKKTLEEAGLTFVFSQEENPDGTSMESRSIFDGDQEIVRIEKSSGLILLSNFLRGYSYTLQGSF